MIDATIVRAHQSAAGARGGQEKQALGRSCGGFSTKIRMTVTEDGMPQNFTLSPGQAADITYARATIGKARPTALLGDRGYDSDSLRRYLKSLKITSVIPGRRCRKKPITYDKALYKKRNVIERFFNSLKRFRRVATRVDKTKLMFSSFINLVCTMIHLRPRPSGV